MEMDLPALLGREGEQPGLVGQRLQHGAQRGVDLVNLLEDIDKNLPKAPPADAENDGE